MDNLICPITQELMDDPILLPCCGQAISRLPLVQFLADSRTCPLCRGDLSNFNAVNAVRLANIASLVEEARLRENPPVALFEPESNILQGKLVLLHDDKPVYQNVIGQLEVDTSTLEKTLILATIDVSGSMDGSPLNQAKMALQSFIDIVYQHDTLQLEIIKYDTSTSVIKIDKNRAQALSKSDVDRIKSGGGTSFGAAFRQIIQTLESYKNSDITNVVVIFLTDGQDGDSDRGPQRTAKFKTTLLQTWTKGLTINTVGFGSSHDADFLFQLKECGNNQGAYRFADPSENSDSLYGKISSLMTGIENSSSSITIVGDTHVISKYQNKYWINMKKTEVLNQLQVKINNKDYTVELEISDAEPNTQNAIWNQWYSYMVDGVAAEILDISNNPSPSDAHLEIRLELLINRCKAIKARIIGLTDDISRLDKLLQTVLDLKAKKVIDAKKVTDLQFEGQYKVIASKNPNPKVSNTVVNKPAYEDNIPNLGSNVQYCSVNWKDLYRIKRDQVSDEYSIHRMAAKGDYWRIGNYSRDQINSLYDGMTPLDYAVVCGNWITVGQLHNLGAKLNIYKYDLRDVCLKRHKPYVKTAALINNLEYLQNVQTGNPDLIFNVYFHQGNMDAINFIPELTSFSWQPYMQILAKPSDNQLDIIEKLLERDDCNPFELFNNNLGLDVWPVFIACEKGQMALLKILCENVDGDFLKKSINMQNSNGTTAFWIAACNNRIDVMDSLIQMGADPTITNLKGDSALIPACQKGYKVTASYLLETGLEPTSANKNGDTPIIISCRTGQADILVTLLDHMDKTSGDKVAALNHKASIDGFDALMAATEASKVACLKVLKTHGCNLEARTSKTNPIIGDATAIHIASMYGCIEALIELAALGADMMAKSFGLNCLHIAVQKSQTSIIDYLLTKYPEMATDFDDNGKLPKFYASEEINDRYFNLKINSLIKNSIINNTDLSDIIGRYGFNVATYGLSMDLPNMQIDGMPLLAHAVIRRNRDLENVLLQNGAQWNVPDDHGITPAFWAHYLDKMQSTDPSVLSQFDKLKSKLKTPSQKMVLKLDDVSRADAEATQFLEYKMNAKSSAQNNSLISNIRKASSSILSYLAESKECFLSAKIRVIRELVNGTIQLDPSEAIAVYLYLNDRVLFNGISKATADANSWTQYKSLHSVIACVYNGLKALPTIEAELYCAIDVPFVENDFKIGSVITWQTFGICSSDWRNASYLVNKKKGIVYIIQSKTGRDVSMLSQYPGDKEYAFLPGTKFNIVAHYLGTLAALGQKNIRKSAYTPKALDYQKANNGEICMIVELEEC